MKKKKAQSGIKVKTDASGYWNPENWGKPVNIPSNEITMRGVKQPLLGISNTGDTQMMFPNNEYKFNGENVVEFPISKDMKTKSKRGKVKKAQSGLAQMLGKQSAFLPKVPKEATFDDGVVQHQQPSIPDNKVLGTIPPQPFQTQGEVSYQENYQPIGKLSARSLSPSALDIGKTTMQNAPQTAPALGKPQPKSDGLSDALGAIPIAGGLIQGIMAIGDQNKAIKREKAATQLAGLNAKAAGTTPKEEMRKYVRPEDTVVSGDELYPVNGVGTDILAKDGKKVPKAFLGSLMSAIGGGGGGGILGGLLGGGGGGSQTTPQGQEAGQMIGSSVGKAADLIMPGLGSMVLSPALGVLGGLIDTSGEQLAAEKKKQTASAMEAAGIDYAKGFQNQHRAFMQDGGKMAYGGDLTVDNGSIQPISENPYSSGTMEFKGPSHDDGGILANYGGNPVEVEGGEPAYVKGNELTIFGNLPITKESAAIIGDKRAAGKKFKTFGKMIANDERKANNIQKRSLDKLDETDERTTFGKLTMNSLLANDIGTRMKLKEAAVKKEKAGMLQEFYNATAEEQGLSAEHLAKGQIKTAKKGANIKKAQYGAYSIFSDDDREYNYAIYPITRDDISSSLKDAIFYYPDGGPNYVAPSPSQSRAQDKVNRYNTSDPYYYQRNRPKSYSSPQQTSVSQSSGASQPSADNYSSRGIGQRPAVVGSLDFGDLPKVNQKDYDYLSGLYDAAKKQGKGNAVKKFQEEYHRIAGPYAQRIIDAYDMTNYGKNKGMKTKGLETNVDGLFGERTEQYFQALGTRPPDSTTVTETNLIPPPEKEEPKETPKKEEPKETPKKEEPKNKFPWQLVGDVISPFMKRKYREGLDWRQLAGEMAAMRDHEEPVYAQLFSPELDTPYDISLQDRLNENTATTRALSRGMGYNPAAMSTLASQKYAADSNVLAEQFRANQAKKDQVYSKNRDILNSAKLTNLGILDKQQERQAMAKSNTKANRQAALSSMASKYLQNEFENKQLGVLENLYPNFGFDRNMNALNQGFSFFGAPRVGSAPVEESGTDDKKVKEKRKGGIVKAIKHL